MNNTVTIVTHEHPLGSTTKLPETAARQLDALIADFKIRHPKARISRDAYIAGSLEYWIAREYEAMVERNSTP